MTGLMKKKLFQGIDLFDFNSLKSKKIALIANHTSINKEGESILSVLKKNNLNVSLIFSPEHGFFPVAQDMEAVEEKKYIQGVEIVSLYGENKDSLKPNQELFDRFDVVIYDIQDIGSRYYTYLATLFIFMEFLEKSDKKLIVLDRINPINGNVVEGCLLQEKYKSFVGYAKMPHRHGFTTGEAVNFFYKTQKMSFELEIIKIQGWERDSFFDDYDYPWIPTSPNMPTLETALIYPGACLVEGTNLSEGRGTTFPFFVVGADEINSFFLAKRLNNLNVDGVSFSPFEFRPMFQKFANKRVGGVFISIKNREEMKPLRLFLKILMTIRKEIKIDDFFRKKTYEFENDIPAIELLLGDENLIKMFYGNADFSEIDDYFLEAENNFLNYRKDFLFY